MFLIRKDRTAVPICRECRKLHGPEECPRRLHGWDANRHAREFYALASAYQAEILRRRNA